MVKPEELVKVISINKESTNLVFIDESAITQEGAGALAKMLKEKNGVDFGAIVLVHGRPEDVVGLISAKDLE